MINMKKFAVLSLSALSLLGIGVYGNSKVSHADTIYTRNTYIYMSGNRIKHIKTSPRISRKKPRANRVIKGTPRYRQPRTRRIRCAKRLVKIARANNAVTHHKPIQHKLAWHIGIPQKMSSANGWISNIYSSHLGNNTVKYFRYTTPLYNSKSYSEGFNARPHYYAFKHETIGHQEAVGNTLGAKNNQVQPYYRALGNNYYSIISGNNFKNGLKIDLDMSEHPWKTTYYTPNYVTVRYINHNNIDIWNHHKFLGHFHRMNYQTATELGY